MRTILLSFDEKWYPALKNGDKIFEHRKKFCDEEVRAFLYLGKPRQQIVAEIGLSQRELLSDWLLRYQDDSDVVARIQDFMQRNKFAMQVLWFREIEPISIVELQEKYPELKIPISFHFLDKKPEVLKWLDENKQYTGYQIENDFSNISKDDICILYSSRAKNNLNKSVYLYSVSHMPICSISSSVGLYSGFLFYDENDMPLVAMHWQHRFNHMVGRYNDIYRVQMPNITPHVCRHTYCSNQAKAGMNPKTLQYLMGHSDISVTMNVYTHISFDDAEAELRKMEEARKAQAEIEKKNEKPMSQKMFKVV